MKKQILHCTPAYPWSGDPQNGSFVSLLVHHLRATSSGFVIHLRHHSFCRTESLLATDAPGISIGSPGGWRGWWFKRKSIQAYIDKKLCNRVDIIYLHMPNPDVLWLALWARRKKIPLVIAEHRSAFLNGDFQRQSVVRRWMVQAVFSLAHEVVVPSQALGKGLRKAGIVKPFTVIPNMIPYPHYRGATDKAEGHRFGMLADVVDSIKGHSGVLSAWSIYSDLHPKDTLHIAGEGVDRTFLMKKFKHLSRVEWLGTTSPSHAVAFLQDIDTLIVHSPVESFSMALAEALGSGCTAIVTRCIGPQEWAPDAPIEWIDYKPEHPLTLCLAMEKVKQRTELTSHEVIALLKPFQPENVLQAHASLWERF